MKIKDLLTSEKRWHQKCCYRDAYGNRVPMTEWPHINGDTPDQIFSHIGSCCLVGALNLCYPGDKDGIYATLREELGMAPGEWNDNPNRTFGEVRALVEKLDI